MKDVIIKNFQVENQHPREKVNVLESKILTLESDHNSLEQYGQHDNIEITGIPDSVSNQNFEEKVLHILNEINVDVSPKDIEACDHVCVSKKAQRKQ